MKLRNKKTGEIRELIVREDNANLYDDSGVFYKMVDSLAELNEEWEDYEPKEPKIPDAECREIMRAWANRCGVKEVQLFCTVFCCGSRSISFGKLFGLKTGITYTIDELCGEEELC